MPAMDNITQIAKEVKKQIVPPLERTALQMRKDKTKTYVVRVDGKANSFGVGEVVIPGVTLFRHGFYGLKRNKAEHLADLLGIQFPYARRTN